jgi:hypothetical protein
MNFSPIAGLQAFNKANLAEKEEAKVIIEAFKKNKVTVTFNETTKVFTVLNSQKSEVTDLMSIFLTVDLQFKILVFENARNEDKKFKVMTESTAQLLRFLSIEDQKQRNIESLTSYKIKSAFFENSPSFFLHIIRKSEEGKKK